jgi:hypothetical protein
MFAIARGEAALRREREALQKAKETGRDTAEPRKRLLELERAQTARMRELAIAIAGDREVKPRRSFHAAGRLFARSFEPSTGRSRKAG